MTLPEQIEAAEVGSRELDATIYQLLNPHMRRVRGKRYLGRFYDPVKTNERQAKLYHISGGATDIAPHYTTSLDAAMTLASGMSETQIWVLWNTALTNCSKNNGDLLTDVARYFASAAIKARGDG